MNPKLLMKIGIPVAIFLLGAFTGYRYASARWEAKYERFVSSVRAEGMDSMTEAQKLLDVRWQAKLAASEQLHRQSEAAHKGAAEDAKRLSEELNVLQAELGDEIEINPVCEEWANFQIGCPVGGSP